MYKGSVDKLKPDPVLKEFWSDNYRFADLFNQVFFDGEIVISPDHLVEQDVEESTVFGDNEKLDAIARYRDVIKQHTDGIRFVLVGLENQMNIHYAMPVRSMLYDSLRYTRQCKALEQVHRREKDLNGADEFLSGMTQSDRLCPVVNLVIYYGEKAWDGPGCLHDMMDVPSRFEPFCNNYKINLLEVSGLKEFKFANKDNQDFFTMVKYFYENDGFVDLTKFEMEFSDKEIYWETMAAIGAATGSKELIGYARINKGGCVNMCRALDNLKLEGIQEGLQEGMKRGMIDAYRDLNIPEHVIVQKLQDRFGMSIEMVQEAMAQ